MLNPISQFFFFLLYTINNKILNMSEETFTAWACKSKSAPLEPMEMTFCHWDEDMVQMDVICCGVCGTDIVSYFSQLINFEKFYNIFF